MNNICGFPDIVQHISQEVIKSPKLQNYKMIQSFIRY